MTDDYEIKTASPRPTPAGPLRLGRNVTNDLMILYNIIMYIIINYNINTVTTIYANDTHRIVL